MVDVADSVNLTEEAVNRRLNNGKPQEADLSKRQKYIWKSRKRKRDVEAETGCDRSCSTSVAERLVSDER